MDRVGQVSHCIIKSQNDTEHKNLENSSLSRLRLGVGRLTYKV